MTSEPRNLFRNYKLAPHPLLHRIPFLSISAAAKQQMRTGPTGAVFLMAQTLLSPVPPPAGASVPHSARHSTITYLYAGLAAMFGLISLALIILTYSHFSNTGSPDEEGGSQKSVTNRRHHRAPYVEQFVVIMAGDANPSFLATPIPIQHDAPDVVDIEKNVEYETERAADGDGTEPH